MTLLLRKFSRILFVCIISSFFISCGKMPKEEADKLCLSISHLQSTDYSGLPDVIAQYQHLADSIEKENHETKIETDNYILEQIGYRNDTLMIATRIILFKPIQVGMWLGEHFFKEALKNDNLSTEERSMRMTDKLNISHFLYEKSGNPSASKEMDLAIDSYINNLDIKTQAKFFTRTSIPENIGIIISREKDSNNKTKLINEIQKYYSNNETLLRRFNNSIKYNNNPINNKENVKP